MWSFDKNLGTAYYKLNSEKELDYDCSDQEAGKSFTINNKNELIGFSFVFPEGWFGPNINNLNEILKKYFDISSLNGNTLIVRNNYPDTELKTIKSDIIIDYKDNKIFGFEFLFKPF